MKRAAKSEEKAIDSRMFGRDWWAQPLEARHASINAHEAGLLVQVEMMHRQEHGDIAPCITWRGNSTQFMTTQFFASGVNVKRSSGRYACPGQLRGTLYPNGDDCFVYVIEWCCIYSTSRMRARRVRQALSDDGYSKFRGALIGTATPSLSGGLHG